MDQSDSSDEEMRGCVFSPSPSPPSHCCSTEEAPSPPSPPSLADSDGHQRDSALFTGPSSALQVLAQRQSTHTGSFLGLDGFLTLGVDLSSVRPGSGPVPAHTPTSQPHNPQRSSQPYSGGRPSWRPSSSLRESAPEELVMAVLESQSPRHTHSRPTSATHRIHSAGGSTPRPAPRPVSRPLSRAAQEILEVQSVEQEAPGGSPQDEEEEEEEDRQALVSLEDEFRQMSAQSGAGTDPPPALFTGVGAGSGARFRGQGRGPATGQEEQRWQSGTARRRASGGHPDEEEENLRDKHNVLALP
ncbi:uncharacterized protein zbbx [Clupea harengus]|uniref:Uncharacterized protein zbbx n=1 Tax=Clupea harengus TaxID=7950 RepID=A0A6P8FZE8_CLUHA|nr:uncharacterized protein zbbx [Clupea harengus]